MLKTGGLKFNICKRLSIAAPFISSPEPNAHDELIVYQSSRRPSVCPSVPFGYLLSCADARADLHLFCSHKSIAEPRNINLNSRVIT